MKAIGSAGRVRSVLIAKGAVGFVRGGAGVCLTGGLVAYVNVRRELRNALRTARLLALSDWGGLWVCKDQASKGIWWMPWHREAMKDVARCDKPRGGASAR